MMVVIYITQQPLKLPFVWYVIYIHRKAVANEYTGLHTCWFKNAGQIHYLLIVHITSHEHSFCSQDRCAKSYISSRLVVPLSLTQLSSPRHRASLDLTLSEARGPFKMSTGSATSVSSFQISGSAIFFLVEHGDSSQ